MYKTWPDRMLRRVGHIIIRGNDGVVIIGDDLGAAGGGSNVV